MLLAIVDSGLIALESGLVHSLCKLDDGPRLIADRQSNDDAVRRLVYGGSQ